MKKTVSVILAAIISLSALFSVNVSAQDNVTYPIGITKEMCAPSYWYDKGAGDGDRLLMTDEEIAAVNQAAIDGKGTNVIDLFNIKETYDATSQKNSLANLSIPSRDWYIDGKKADKTEIFNNIISAIKETGYEGTQNTKFAVCTSHAELKAYPIDKFVGYSAADPDNEIVNSALCVNEPFAVRAKCDIDGETFYWGYTHNCTGWINAKNLAICADRDEWLDTCKADIGGDDFIVVTQDKIITEPSISAPYMSEVRLNLGTVLKLVPEDEIPQKIGERGAWNNYVVYLPVRNDDGTYAKKIALIPEHCSVSVGYLPFTQKNLIDVAFSCLGNRYGWAGMLYSMDCSLYTRIIYRCFGFEIPRNTTWQQLVPDTMISFDGLDEPQREKLIETMPIGTLLYFDGHTMMYIGSENETNYVISDLGTVVESEGEIVVKTAYSVVVNSLTVRRGSGKTWLSQLTGTFVAVPKADMSECEISAVKDENGEITVKVSYEGKELYEDINYTVEIDGDTVTVSGINNFNGTASVNAQTVKVCFLQKIINFFTTLIQKIIAFFK